MSDSLDLITCLEEWNKSRRSVWGCLKCRISGFSGSIVMLCEAWLSLSTTTAHKMIRLFADIRATSYESAAINYFTHWNMRWNDEQMTSTVEPSLTQRAEHVKLKPRRIIKALINPPNFKPLQTNVKPLNVEMCLLVKLTPLRDCNKANRKLF